ncbi:hypothetical protein [Ferrimonas marina]|uniref:Uncharacterized protein n=1 Tax=Ferrimonas marina TaxID=299255 RepID=A0A1M5YV00_9GAMM|nr:hypothetical protein [Ferrimonas marina]SHI15698.1 hypothetical protein SAMN02745129_4473 [Ferrimonas marina]
MKRAICISLLALASTQAQAHGSHMGGSKAYQARMAAQTATVDADSQAKQEVRRYHSWRAVAYRR